MTDETRRANSSSPFSRFQSLTKRLLAVPKPEVDAKAAEEPKKPRKPRVKKSAA
jgi:hypothetical protein